MRAGAFLSSIALALALALGTLALSQAAPVRSDVAAEAKARAEAEKFADPAVKALLTDLYIEQLKTEVYDQQAARRLREAETRRYERWVVSLSDEA